MTALSLGLVAIGSALGGMARYAVGAAVARRVGERFPWGTLLVNISGSLLIGCLAGLVATNGPLPGNATLRELGMIGVCGGYTTFSSFSLQTLTLARGREGVAAVLYIVGSTGLCLVAVWVGLVGAGLFAKGSM